MFLSKSKLQKHRQCPKYLWLAENNPTLEETNDISEIIMEQGNVFGSLIKNNFYNTFDIKEKNIQKAIIETNNLIKEIVKEEKDATIFEPAFLYKDVIVRVDIFEYISKLKKWNITEVKSGNIFKKLDIKDHLLFDAAIQNFVVKNNNIRVNNVYLGYPNKKFVLKTEGDYKNLLSLELINTEVQTLFEEVENEIKSAYKNILQTDEPDINIDSHCNKPHHCSFINYCSKAEILKDEKLDTPVWYLGGSPTVKIVKSLMEKGYRDLSQVPDEYLKTDIQIKMKKVSQTKKNFIDKKLIKFLENEPWPRYFLDYETISSPFPLFLGTSPGGRIPFQYSIHKWEQYDKEPIAFDFVHNQTSDPRTIMGQKICEIITEKKCGIYTWHGRSVEAPITKDIINFTEETKYKDQLRNILELMKKGDLLPYFKENFYMYGQENWSVKSIAENLLDHNPYSDLKIKGGAEAMEIYHQYRKINNTNKNEMKKNLIDYCAVDTSVMIDIWKAVLSYN